MYTHTPYKTRDFAEVEYLFFTGIYGKAPVSSRRPAGRVNLDLRLLCRGAILVVADQREELDHVAGGLFT